jgi:hypothetical protein
MTISTAFVLFLFGLLAIYCVVRLLLAAFFAAKRRHVQDVLNALSQTNGDKRHGK